MLGIRLLLTSSNADAQAFVQSPARAEDVQTRFRAYPGDPAEVPSLERAGDLSLDLSTHCQRETFSSIVTHVQTYLSKIAAWSYHYAQHFHVLFPLFYQTIEASQAS
jgi:hypothetical protein